jgi:hypothetical protein
MVGPGVSAAELMIGPKRRGISAPTWNKTVDRALQLLDAFRRLVEHYKTLCRSSMSKTIPDWPT